MAWWNKCSSVYIYKTYGARNPSNSWWISTSFLMLSLGSVTLQLYFMHPNSPTSSFAPYNCLLFPPSLLPQPPPLSLLSLWCQPPGLLDQRAFLWDHLERPVEVEEEKERGGTRDTNRERRKKWEASGEPRGRRGSGKEVFLSRSTAAQSHIQYFPLEHTLHTYITMPVPCCQEDHCICFQGFRSLNQTWYEFNLNKEHPTEG